MANVFISYKREQREWVAKLVTLLESQGLTVWWDPKIEVGEEYFKIINQVIKEVDCILVIWSHDSVDSQWVISEATVGMERKNMIPILLNKVSPPIPFNILQSADFSEWNGEENSECATQLLTSIQKYCSFKLKDSETIPLTSHNEAEKQYFFSKATEETEANDARAWKVALKEDSKRGYKMYLKEFSNGKYQKKAKKKLRTLAFKKQMFFSLIIIGVLTVLIVVKKLGA